MSQGAGKRPPLSPREAWISDGRQGLPFRPTLWDRWSQRLEITSGELPPDQPMSLLKEPSDFAWLTRGAESNPRNHYDFGAYG